MPPMTPVPMARRLLAPAPVAMASGTQPRMKASEVMTIGRSRSRAASMAASAAVMPCAHVLGGELDDQDGVLGRQPDQGHQADLEIDVVFQPAEPGQQQGAADGERDRQHDADRQRPLLVLGGQDQEDHDQAEDEGRRGGAAGLLLLKAWPAQAKS